MLTIKDNIYPDTLLTGFNAGTEPYTVTRNMDGDKILFAHGYESGLLNVDDETLLDINPKFVACCYPKRVAQVYKRIFPAISFIGADVWDCPVNLTIEYGQFYHSIILCA